ncbi:dynamin family protein [Paenibacillus sp. 481]|nr:dynamin family protein [Paenibacillus sp. 481]
MAAQMRQAGDERCAAKLVELAGKWENRTLMLTFCGHFSAGKSSVINRLCGQPLLPSSPIPTSANVVTVRYGQSRAEVVRRDGGSESVSLESLGAVCRDGESIERVTLFAEVDWLRAGAALLDTPGVDSTDEAHREATESAMHLADVVFYVTDYNHVQSEFNFAFAKKVADAGKPLIWIVNQIDKHREQELPFSDYKQDVRNALEAWQLQPAAVFFVTVKQPEHPYNEWMKFTTYLQELIAEREQIVRYGVEQATSELIREHMHLLAAPLAEQRAAWIEEAGGEDVVAERREQLMHVRDELDTVRQQADHVRGPFNEELAKLLRDANVTPAVTRDLAQSYLETLKPGFKVGLLFTTAKTQAERERRLLAFAQQWQEGVRANVGVHVIQMVRKLAQAAGQDEIEWAANMEAALPELAADWLAKSVQAGSWGSAEYTLNYSRTISDEAKAMIRRAAMVVAEPLLESKRQQHLVQADLLQEEQVRLAQLLAVEETIAERERELAAQSARMHAELGSVRASDEATGWSSYMPSVEAIELKINQSVIGQSDTDGGTSGSSDNLLHVDTVGSGELVDGIREQRGSDDPVESIASMETTGHVDPIELTDSIDPTSSIGSGAVADEGRTETSHARSKLLHTATQLEQAADALEQLPSVQALASSMRSKAQRLQANRFTVALFGAFSAGKSSFANALIGQDALPVSPNPTTAAINTIGAPTEEYPHGTARVLMKSEARMLDDIRYALESIGERNTDQLTMEQALKAIDRWKPDMLHPSGRPHFSFIQAVKRGYDAARHHLGGSLRVDEREYRQYVADESRSAFVERIELHVDSPLTAEGFVFVDTPGADSINARHTGVAFEYIKNADVILFVTYYNHAFSQADRQFLSQLGRVKDAFELDKMFFLVNAADLAASQEELESVTDYVSGRLHEYGIRSPRLFPVSSLKALEAKQQRRQEMLERSGIPAFEQAFMRFATDELAGMAVEAAQADLLRAEGQLQAMWNAAHADADARVQQAAHIRQMEAELLQACDTWVNRDERQAVTQEADELLYHVRQRLQFRFGDWFAYAFNPASLRKDERNIDAALEHCYREWARTFTKELLNELYATTLRLEQQSKRLIQAHWSRFVPTLNEKLPGCDVTLEPFTAWPTPDVKDSAWVPEVNVRWLRGYYRNSKAFFEAGGRDELKRALEEQAMQAVQRAVQQHRELFIDHMMQQSSALLHELEAQLTHVVRRHADSLEAASSVDFDPAPIAAALKQIQQSRL